MSIILCKHIQLQPFEILSPRWRDKKVLLMDKKLADLNKVVFTGQDGKSMGTVPYVITGKRAKQFGTEMMDTRDGRQVKMRVVPIDALELLGIKERCEHEIS